MRNMLNKMVDDCDTTWIIFIGLGATANFLCGNLVAGSILLGLMTYEMTQS